MKRRKFLNSIGAMTAFIGLNSITSCFNSNDKLKILVLGGTNFVGPSIVKSLIQNHNITLFNRGITNPELFSNIPLIKGDRLNGKKTYFELQNHTWDVVIDVWPEKSFLVDDSTSVLKNNCKHYVFISSIAVYDNFNTIGLDENSRVVSLNNNKNEWEYYEEKLASELIVKERFPNNFTILRPGPIKGWRDPAKDLLYWCLKFKSERKFIAPGSGLDPIQFIDTKDIGRFISKCINDRLYGIYNCTGPEYKTLLWKDFLNALKSHFDSTSEMIWANESILRQFKIRSFSDLPLWAPLSEDRGFMQISNRKLLETGFKFTPIQNTFEDCYNWWVKNGSLEINFGVNESIGLDRVKETDLINYLKT